MGITFDEVNGYSLWLNYSSIVEQGKTRKISAKLDGELPDGLDFTASATNDIADLGKGKWLECQKQRQQVLSSGETEIVKEIGSCYTGNGLNNGHKLEYTLRLEDADDVNYTILKRNYNITVTYNFRLVEA